MNKRGFTLLELIVAVGVFSIVAVLSVSSLLSLTNAQKKALALETIQDNLRFSLSAMARDLVTGNFFYCSTGLNDLPPVPNPGEAPTTQDCPILPNGTGGSSMITFLNSQNKVVTYRLVVDGSIETSCGVDGAHQCIEKATRSHYDETPGFTPATSHDVEITQLKFFVAGSGANDKTEPRITIVLDGVAGQGSNATTFHLQTTVSQRTAQRQ